MSKKLKLKVGDFFHVEVVETCITEKGPDIHKFKLEVKDGPIVGSYLYFDTRLNSHIKEPSK